jgi:hypothetical protein
MLYLAIDVHRKPMTISLRDEAGQVVVHRQVSTWGDEPTKFLEDVTRRSGAEGYLAILEVCGFHEWLAELLPQHGCREVVLIQPEKRSRRKTDRRERTGSVPARPTRDARLVQRRRNAELVFPNQEAARSEDRPRCRDATIGRDLLAHAFQAAALKRTKQNRSRKNSAPTTVDNPSSVRDGYSLHAATAAKPRRLANVASGCITLSRFGVSVLMPANGATLACRDKNVAAAS